MVERVERVTTPVRAPLPPQVQEALVQQAASKPAGPSRVVCLRNDAPALRTVIDVNGRRVNVAPSQIILDVDLPLTVIKMLEDDAVMKLRNGRHNILRIIPRALATQALEDNRPPPDLSPEREAMLDLAARAESFGMVEYQERARDLLGTRFPSGKVTKDDIVTALQLHGRGGPTGG